MLDFENKVAIKICGITNVPDALVCAAAGVDMLGLNFSPCSSRCITRETAGPIAAAIRAQFPRVKLVGVFVDQEREFVHALATALALDAVQLHGNETIEDVVVAGIGDPGWSEPWPRPSSPGSPIPATTRALFVIKALRVSSQRPAFAAYAEKCDAILLDTWSAQSPGGTGETFPWSIAAELRPQVTRLILAGGLTSANVGEAIQIVRPFAVDVCSGVESAPGRKDEAKVRAFVRAVEKMNNEKTAIRA